MTWLQGHNSRKFFRSDNTMQNLENINVAEVLDRVLDHGIVVEPSTQVFLLGVDLHAIHGRLVVELVETY